MTQDIDSDDDVTQVLVALARTMPHVYVYEVVLNPNASYECMVWVATIQWQRFLFPDRFRISTEEGKVKEENERVEEERQDELIAWLGK